MFGWYLVNFVEVDICYNPTERSTYPLKRMQCDDFDKTEMAKTHLFWKYHHKNPVSRAMVGGKMLYFVAFFVNFD